MPSDVALSYSSFEGNDSFTVCKAVLSALTNRLAFTPGKLLSRCCSISLLSSSRGTPLMRALCSFVLSFAFRAIDSPPKNSGFQDFKTLSASSTVRNSKCVLHRAVVNA